MNERDIILANVVYTPEYRSRDNLFIIGEASATFPSPEEAKENALSAGLDYVVSIGAEPTGRVVTLPREGGPPGLKVDFMDRRILIIGGPLWKKSRDMKDLSAVEQEVKDWLGYEA